MQATLKPVMMGIKMMGMGVTLNEKSRRGLLEEKPQIHERQYVEIY